MLAVNDANCLVYKLSSGYFEEIKLTLGIFTLKITKSKTDKDENFGKLVSPLLDK